MISDPLRQHLRSCQNIVVFTGAELSAESGVPTFRDRLGNPWVQYDSQEMATPEAFRANPQLVWDWHVHLAETIQQAKPNAGHEAIARMQDFGPRITVLTTNIDRLHQAAGSRNIAELHGTLARLKGFSDHEAQQGGEGFTDCQLCGGMTRAENCNPAFDPTGAAPIKLVAGPVPHCPACGLFLRPDIVWFGEPLDERFERFAYMVAMTCDALICIGTSQDVRSESWVPRITIDEGKNVIEIDTERTEISGYADVFLQGRLVTILPQLVEEIFR
jgi:NAD-dependent deacetylase